MAQSKHFYITTTLPYVNANPHVGHALEFVRADIVARYRKGLGYKVFFNTGTDEHGLKIYRKAVAEGREPQEYVDHFSARFKELTRILGLSVAEENIHFNFIRTTDPKHIEAAQAFWKVCDKNGHIYKKEYKIKYCVGCELEKTDSELVDGKCPDHPNLELEIIEEENYFFKFSSFGVRLLKLYEERPNFVLPVSRLNEMKAFVGRGLEDFSISRLKSKVSWGVPVPGDDNHVMYVWFDALVNYISATGWPSDMNSFDMWWPVTQYCGKDNTRQQSAMWQAMLMAAGLEPSKQIIVNGFVLGGGGIKMSKSLGNVVDPVSVVSEYGAEAFRYFVARELHPFEDSDFTMERFKDAYNAHLANGLGNLVSRVMKMSESYKVDISGLNALSVPDEYKKAMESYRFNEATHVIWTMINEADARIQREQPFKVVKVDEVKAHEIIRELVQVLLSISHLLVPFMPETAIKINQAVKNNSMPEPLFLRKD